MAAKYLIARRVKERAKALKVRISPAAVDVVDSHIQDMLKKAAERAKENKRKTIMPHDI
jgi:histone H3/H4